MDTLAATVARADADATPVARIPAANFVADPAVRYDVLLDGARIAALKDLGLLDTTAEETFDRYTRLATTLLGVSVSLITLVDADRAFFKSQSGLPDEMAHIRQVPLSHSLCKHVAATQQPLIVSDTRANAMVAENPAVSELGVIAYAGMPLVLSDGNAVGTFCAVDQVPHEWSEHDLQILSDLAAAVTAHLELHRAMAERSLNDRLTGIANRELLCAQADHLLQAAAPDEAAEVTAICIGLDGFALVNDAFGAQAADRVLQEVAERLAPEVRRDNILGRFSGDVFAVVSAGIGDHGALVRFAERLRAAISDTAFDIDGHRIGITASVGTASGAQGKPGADLLAGADDAMRRGKSSAGAVLSAVAGTAEVAAAQLRLRTALCGAVDRGEMDVAYQPIVGLQSGTPIGFEALARWNSPELGSVSPVVFIPAAERTGEIVKIGEWILRRACSQLARWRRDDAELTMSVNIAPLQLELPNLTDIVAGALDDHGLPPSALVLEITEGVLIGAGALQTRNLQLLRQLGVRIALDDFGTGYSALGYLKRFAIDQLKIDRSFITALETDRRDAAFVQAILALARGLGLTVVAEGIETVGQHQALKLLGCAFGQGYLFAPPRTAAQLSGGQSGS
jgi:diguanylate cyclase (GGDEF)-like protein